MYKEGLKAVIEPTVKSIKQAISTYELQGGTANVFINDDGLQLMKNKKDRDERIEFYADHNIGWVARPGHNDNGFIRKGKFKKVCFFSTLAIVVVIVVVCRRCYSTRYALVAGTLQRDARDFRLAVLACVHSAPLSLFHLIPRFYPCFLDVPEFR